MRSHTYCTIIGTVIWPPTENTTSKLILFFKMHIQLEWTRIFLKLYSTFFHRGQVSLTKIVWFGSTQIQKMLITNSTFVPSWIILIIFPPRTSKVVWQLVNHSIFKKPAHSNKLKAINNIQSTSDSPLQNELSPKDSAIIQILSVIDEGTDEDF